MRRLAKRHASMKDLILVLAAASACISSEAATDAVKVNLREFAEGLGGNSMEGQKARGGGGGGFDASCLRGRFSYFNTASGVASLSVGVFDGEGNISEMEGIEINMPNPSGVGRLETTIGFNSGTYEVQPSGKGKMYVSLGEAGGPYFDPPAELVFVVTGTAGGCEVTSMESFQVAGLGLADQLVVPRWTKIADE